MTEKQRSKILATKLFNSVKHNLAIMELPKNCEEAVLKELIKMLSKIDRKL